jgi:antitoxin CcdA
MGDSGRAAVRHRGATNVSISPELLDEAWGLGINVSQAAERGLAYAIAEQRAVVWLEESRAAIESSNAFIADHGVEIQAPASREEHGAPVQFVSRSQVEAALERRVRRAAPVGAEGEVVLYRSVKGLLAASGVRAFMGDQVADEFQAAM